MHVLLSNDDGLDAEGLQLLRRELKRACPDWRVTTVAPDREKSASSHALTLHDPLRVEDRGGDQYAVSGTPTDCLLIAVKGILKEDPPDVVLSGINHGQNMGEDIHYSGTVAAAFEGMVLGLPAMAISLASRERPRNFDAATRFIHDVMPGWLMRLKGKAALLNVNIPACPPSEVTGIRFCKLGSREYHDMIVQKEDPRGRAYYWIGGDSFTFADHPNTDFVLSSQGYITVTPLHVDATDYKQMVELESLASDWPL